MFGASARLRCHSCTTNAVMSEASPDFASLPSRRFSTLEKKGMRWPMCAMIRASNSTGSRPPCSSGLTSVLSASDRSPTSSGVPILSAVRERSASRMNSAMVSWTAPGCTLFGGAVLRFRGARVLRALVLRGCFCSFCS